VQRAAGQPLLRLVMARMLELVEKHKICFQSMGKLFMLLTPA